MKTGVHIRLWCLRLLAQYVYTFVAEFHFPVRHILTRLFYVMIYILRHTWQCCQEESEGKKKERTVKQWYMRIFQTQLHRNQGLNTVKGLEETWHHPVTHLSNISTQRKRWTVQWLSNQLYIDNIKRWMSAKNNT